MITMALVFFLSMVRFTSYSDHLDNLNNNRIILITYNMVDELAGVLGTIACESENRPHC